MMKISTTNTVGEIVSNNYRTAHVFESHRIDFCCNGNRILSDVAQERDLDIHNLISELELSASTVVEPEHDYASWPLDILADYIVQVHHSYVENSITTLKPYLDKICHVHGAHHPELHSIKDIFEQSAGELAGHQKKEEIIVFPFIKRLVHAAQNNESISLARSVANPISMLTDEHDAQGDAFRQISELCNNYTPPSDACNTYIVTLNMLKEFEADLHKHIHLENNILFPKAIELEKQVARV